MQKFIAIPIEETSRPPSPQIVRDKAPPIMPTVQTLQTIETAEFIDTLQKVLRDTVERRNQLKTSHKHYAEDHDRLTQRLENLGTIHTFVTANPTFKWLGFSGWHPEATLKLNKEAGYSQIEGFAYIQADGIQVYERLGSSFGLHAGNPVETHHQNLQATETIVTTTSEIQATTTWGRAHYLKGNSPDSWIVDQDHYTTLTLNQGQNQVTKAPPENVVIITMKGDAEGYVLDLRDTILFGLEREPSHRFWKWVEPNKTLLWVTQNADLTDEYIQDNVLPTSVRAFKDRFQWSRAQSCQKVASPTFAQLAESTEDATSMVTLCDRTLVSPNLSSDCQTFAILYGLHPGLPALPAGITVY